MRLYRCNQLFLPVLYQVLGHHLAFRLIRDALPVEIFFLTWILCSIGVGVFASQRGRSGLGWGLLSLVTSPLLAVIILLLMKDLVEEAAAQERGARRHIEQMAALSGASQRGGAPQAAPAALASAPPVVAQALLLVADELEKLASLKDRGLLTVDEFAVQKARLLSGATVTGNLGWAN